MINMYCAGLVTMCAWFYLAQREYTMAVIGVALAVANIIVAVAPC